MNEGVPKNKYMDEHCVSRRSFVGCAAAAAVAATASGLVGCSSESTRSSGVSALPSETSTIETPISVKSTWKSSGSYDWCRIAERLDKAVEPTSSVVAIRYCKTKDEVEAIPNIKNFGDEQGVVCSALPRVANDKETLWFDASNCFFDYCSINNGLLPRDESYESGEVLVADGTTWHDTIDLAKAHIAYEQKGIPEGGDNILCFAPMESGDIDKPDVLLLRVKPGAVFILLAGMLYYEYSDMSFTFVGESNCTDCWGYTFVTGKPGMSFGCKGERAVAFLKDDEMHLSLTPDQLVMALDGFDNLQMGGIGYPYK